MQEFSAVLILPAALKDAGDVVANAQDWGEIAYTIHLSNDGGETVTHIGCRADVSEKFVRQVTGLEPLPDPSIAPVVNALIWDFSPDPDDEESPHLWGRDHLDAVLAAQGLVQVEV